MNGLSNVKADYNKNTNYYLMPNNNTSMRTIKMQQEPRTTDTARTAATAGILQAFALFLHKASEYCGNELMKGEEFTNETDVKKVAESMVKKNKLNVKVDFIDKFNIKNYSKDIQEALGPVARGENAFYSDNCKLAVAPKSKPSLILHELGHAINAHKGKFLKMLQKSRMYVSAVPTALLVLNGLFKRKDEKPNFIERNAGIIGFASFLPTIAEEGLASIRGVKAARKTLGKAVNLNPLRRNYLFAWMTYVIAGLGLGVAAKQAIIENKKQ